MKKSGFTMMEIMIVVIIIGILSGVAMVKYANLLRKAQEGELMGDLGTLRSALSIYYSDMDGVYPNSITVLTVSSKYINAIPTAKPPNYHLASSAVTLGTVFDDSGGWLFNNVEGEIKHGLLSVNCNHTDTKGSAWSAY